MKPKTLLVSGAAAVTAVGIGVGGAALANANNQASTTANPSASATSSPGAQAQGGRHRPGVAASRGLSGDAAVKAVQAAVTKEPSAVLLRAVKADDGGYRVAMRRTDGTRITLTLDSNFTVTGTQEHATKPQRSAKPTQSPTTTATS